jgi:hypothetical protein
LPNKTTYYNDQVYGLLLQVSDKEYPEDEDAVNKVILDLVKGGIVALAKKHKIKVPKKLQEAEST